MEPEPAFLTGALVSYAVAASGFGSLHESLDTATPGGRLVFHVFAALAAHRKEVSWFEGRRRLG